MIDGMLNGASCVCVLVRLILPGRLLFSVVVGDEVLLYLPFNLDGLFGFLVFDSFDVATMLVRASA
jgi:hypothetical protein